MIYSDMATWVGPTPNRTAGGMGTVYGAVLHIQEGNEAGTEAWQKNPAAQVSSHFLAPKSGRLRQMVDTADRAWCQAAGNTHWWSIEIEGHSGDRLTADQLEACAQVLARAHRDKGVPLAATNNPNATNPAGLGYHAMGGNPWGGHFDCPGQPIIDARPAIVARAQQIVGGATMAEFSDPRYADAMAWRMDALMHMRDTIIGGPFAGEPAETVQVLARIDEAVQNLGAVTLTDADLDKLAQKTAALLVPAMTAANATALADELAKRLGNG